MYRKRRKLLLEAAESISVVLAEKTNDAEMIAELSEIRSETDETEVDCRRLDNNCAILRRYACRNGLKKSLIADIQLEILRFCGADSDLKTASNKDSNCVIQ